ncbi:MucBP domain-containing protein [Enterococcus sp. LJL90]
MEKRVEYKKRVAKSKKRKLSKAFGISSMGLICAVTLGMTHEVQAAEWTANTPEQIVIADGATEYTMNLGDTLWAIGMKINVSHVDLAEVNGIDLQAGEQYSLPVGRAIKITQDGALTATDSNGTVVGEKQNASKVDETKDYGYNIVEASQNPTISNGGTTSNPSGTSTDGGENATNTNSNSSNNGNTNNGGSNNAGSENGGTTPEAPTNPTDPSNPTDPEQPGGEDEETAKPVIIRYINTDGTEIADSKTVEGEIGDMVSATALEIEGYTLVGDKLQEVFISATGQTITFTYQKSDVENPEVVAKPIVINYMDLSGNSIKGSDTVVGKIDEEVIVNAPTIDGYTVQGDITHTLYISSTLQTINFYYSKDNEPTIEAQPVIVSYVDTAGNTLKANTQLTGNVGDIVTAIAPAISGYTAQSPTSVSKTISGEVQYIQFVYKKDEVTPPEYTVGQELERKTGFQTTTDVDTEMWEAIDRWTEFGMQNGFLVTGYWAGVEGEYYYVITVDTLL